MTNAAPRNPTRWLAAACSLVATAIILTIALAATFGAGWTSECWMRYAAGGWILQHGPPQADPFSWTAPGATWIDPVWGYDALLRLLTDAVGIRGVLVIHGLLLGAAFDIARRAAGRRGVADLAWSASLLGIVVAAGEISIGPGIAGLLIASLMYACLMRHAERKGRWIWLTIALQVTAVNLCGPFFAGPLIVGGWWFGVAMRHALKWHDDGTFSTDDRRSLARATAVLLATVVVLLANPYMAGVLSSPSAPGARLFGLASGAKAFNNTLFDGETRTIVLILATMGISTASLAWRPHIDRLASAFIFGVLGVATMIDRSAAPLMALTAVWVISGAMQRTDRETRLSIGWRGHFLQGLLAALFGVCLVVYAVPQVMRNRTPDSAALSGPMAIESLGGLPMEARDSHIFNDADAGALLAASGVKCFIDPRQGVYGEPLSREYRFALIDPARFDELAERRAIETCVLSLNQSTLIAHLASNPRWRVAGIGSGFILFASGGSTNLSSSIDPIGHVSESIEYLRTIVDADARSQSVGPWATRRANAARIWTARACLSMNAPVVARQMLQDALDADPGEFTAWPEFAAAARFMSDLETSGFYMERSVAESPDNDELRKGAASLYLSMGDGLRAESLMRPLLERHPEDADALEMIGLALLIQRSFPEAQERIAAALKQRPERASLHRNLAQSLIGQQQVEPAIAHYRTAFVLDPSEFAAARDLARIMTATKQLEEARHWTRIALGLRGDDAQMLELSRRLADSAPSTQ